MTSIPLKVATIEAVESLIQYKFNHSALLWEALQCPGSPDAKHPNGNKRLAIIGDTVLLLALAETWFKGDKTIGRYERRHPSTTSTPILYLGKISHTDTSLSVFFFYQAISTPSAKPSLQTPICNVLASKWVLSDSSALRRVVHRRR